VAFAAYRLPELTRYSLWFDEVFAVTLAQMGWLEMLGAAIRDRTNPPLFYVLLKLWTGLGGESVAWMRLLPCLFAIGAGPLIVQLARRTGCLTAGLAATAAGAASPLLVFLSNEIRGYSLLLFLSALTMISFARVVETIGWEAKLEAEGSSPNGLGDVAPERRRRIVLFALCALALVYTHYFGWLLLGALMSVAWLWFRPMLTPLLFAAGAVGFMFAPWAISVWVASQGVAAPLANVSWISMPTAGDLPRFYDALVARVLTPQTAWVGLIVLAMVAAGLVARFRSGTDRTTPALLRTSALCLLAIVPVLVAFVASVAADRPIFVPRYLVVAAPAWWLLLGSAASANSGLAAAFTVFTLTAGALREARGGEKIQWDDVVQAISRDAGPAGGTIYSLEGFTALPAAFYARGGGTSLEVRPVGDLMSMKSPAWLVVRTGAHDSSAVLGGGLTPRDLSLTEVYRAEVPSHAIVAYRVGVK
jgi:mannosyltransferase